jgi:hypothetical protein
MLVPRPGSRASSSNTAAAGSRTTIVNNGHAARCLVDVLRDGQPLCVWHDRAVAFV